MSRVITRLTATLAVAIGVSTCAAAPLTHAVFFTLAEDNADNRRRLVDACHEHLAGHDGVLHFSVGEVAAGLDREVNDREFDVALLLVFDGREAHDAYQTHPRHLRFVERAGPLWSRVRVFDSEAVPADGD